MKAKTKFMKMYYKLPEQARRELVIDFTTIPRSLNVCMSEIMGNTLLGKEILKRLGYNNE